MREREIGMNPPAWDRFPIALCHEHASLRPAAWSSLDRDPNVLTEEKKETHQSLQ
jgi:hypothetical protein